MFITEVSSMKDEEEETISVSTKAVSKSTTRQILSVSESLIETILGQRELSRPFIKCFSIDDRLQEINSQNLALPMKSIINNNISISVNQSKVIKKDDQLSLEVGKKMEKDLRIIEQELKRTKINYHRQENHLLIETPPNNVITKIKRFNPQKRHSIEMNAISDHLFKLFMFLIATILYAQQLFVFQANCQKHYFHHQNNHNTQQFLQSPNDSLLMRVNQRQAIEGLFKGHNAKSIKHQQVLKQQQRQQHQQTHPHLYHDNQQLYQNYRHNNINSTPRFPQTLNADRRASSNNIASIPSPPSATSTTTTTTTAQPNQAQADYQNTKDNGKLLVCYYTTRQSAPYWPKDAREYVIPADGLNSINGANDLSQMAFAPILQYEPFARVNHRNSINNNQNNEAQQASSDFPSAGNIKNQQQQLVFKSAAMMQLSAQQQQQQQQQQQHLTGGPSSNGVGINTKAMLASYNNGNKSKQLQHHHYQNNNYENAAISQLLEQQPLHNSHIDQQTLIIASTPIDSGFAGKNKQTTAYSFIGDLDANNGLIFNGGSGTISPSLQPSINSIGGSSLTTSALASQHNHSGNNGNNNFILGKDNNSNRNNNGNHLERNLIKQPTSNQAQQLVFSPSLSRTFVVGPNSSGSGSNTNNNNINNNNNNNEVLDTKSQLFISSQPQQAQTSYNNQLHQQTTSTTTSTTSNLPVMYQQHDLVALQKAKSLQLMNGEHLSSLHPFSGPVSSTPPVPLSSASSSLVHHSTPASYRSSQHNQQQHHTYTTSANNNNQPQQKQFLPNSNQLILGSGQTTSGSTNSQKSSATGGNVLPGMKLSYQASAANSVNSNLGSKSSSSPSSSPPLSLASPSSSSSSSSSSSLSNLGLSSSTSTNTAGLSSQLSSYSSSSQPLNGSNSGISSSGNSGGGGNLSSALVSSPLSTMFDVFGAASQYLMRFKPSSLISPAAFTFNTIPNDHNHHHQQHHGLKSNNSSSSSILNSLSSGSTASLIPLPFSSSLTPSMQKSSASASSNDRSSNSNTGSIGVISRLALQNNQRREDVCGKTIQTPQRRIIGGEGARYGEFPYQVHIKIAKHQCGGALVDKQSIVTAAHCVYHFITRAPVSKLQIVIGAYDIEDEQYQELPPQYFKVNKVKLHPNFRFSASHPDRYDIAILKLDKPVKYTDNVLPVCLPSKDLKFESMVGTVTGFGKTDPSLSNRYGTRLLQKVDVPIIENNECERWHRTRGIDLKIFPEMMCAGYEDGLKDACVGDSGGPLVVKTAAGPNGSFRWTLAGITSAGFGCAQSRQPGIYHRVSHTVDWILQNLD